MLLPISNNKYLLLYLSVFYFYSCSVISAEYNQWTLIGPGDADQVTSLSINNDGDVYAGTDIGGIYRSIDNGQSWNVLNNGLLNLDITTPIIHDDKKGTHYVGTRGGFYKTTDNGLSWRNIRAGLPVAKKSSLSGSIGSIVTDPHNTSRLYLGMGYRPSTKGNSTVLKLDWLNHIFVSLDKGDSWNKLPAFGNVQRVSQIVVAKKSKGIIYVAAGQGIFKSTDSGSHWIKVYSGSVLNLLDFSEKPDLLIASVGNKGVIKSDDGGVTWRSINKGLSFGYLSQRSINRYSVLASSAATPGEIYVTNSTWKSAGGLYKSEDYGETWEFVSKKLPESWLKTSRRMNAVAVSSDDVLFLGSSRYIYRFDNNEAKWKQLISKKIDDGWAHTGINVFGNARAAKSAPASNDLIYVGTADHGIVRSTNGGVSWNPIGTSLEYADNIWGIDVCPSKPESLFIVSSNIKGNLCVYASHDKGDNWQSHCADLGKTNRNERIYVDPQDCTTTYVAGSKGLFRGSNAKGDWRLIFKQNNLVVNDVAFSSKKSGLIYVATKKGIYHSKNAGISWNKLPSLQKTNITSIMVSSIDAEVIFAGSNIAYNKSAEIYRSNDGGRTWQTVQSGIRKYISAFTQISSKPSVLYASTNDFNYHDSSSGAGVFRSDDHGLTWKDDNKGLPLLRAFDISSSDTEEKKVYLSTQGSGVYVKTLK